ncbi:MAG: N-acetylornithine carbamoyltransferase [Thermoanaerobaculia bacterium]|nr:N-acetylornithine carbamoyltransferase [Thermoanaerobaculia bacterium]
MNRFLSLGALEPGEIRELVALAGRLEARPEPAALAGRVLGLLFFDPSLRTLASMQSAMARLGGSSFVISPGRGSWALETRDGVVMDGAAAEHVREALPVLAGYADVLGVRAFASLSDLEADLADEPMATFARLVDRPLVNLESAIDHPCQALGDWKAMDDLGVPPAGRLVLTWANHPRPLPLAVPAAVAEMGALRGMEVVVVRPEPYAFPPALSARVARAAARGGGSFRESAERDEALAGAAVVYAKSWAASERYGDGAAESERRRALADWCVDEPWFARAPAARLFHCLPVRRNVVVADRVLDGPRSAVVHQAHQRLWAQMAVLHRMLAGRGNG